MLKVSDLHAKINGEPILNGVDLFVPKNSVHVILGPNGSGKSSLCKVLTRFSSVDVVSGQVEFKKQNIFEVALEVLSQMGLFLAFQHPVDIEGVSLANLLKIAVNNRRKFLGLEELSVNKFMDLLREKVEFLGLPEKFYQNSVNKNLSGGQKKLAELFQLSVLDPDLAILDEIDAGLDVDNLKSLAENILKLQNGERSFLVITHNPKFIEMLKPAVVTVMIEGKTVVSGGLELAKEVEKNGYEGFKK